MRNKQDLSNTSDVVVVGGGVIGMATARALGRGGWQVTLIERQGRLGEEASSAAAGMLAPQAEANGADEFFRLQCASRELYPALAGALRDETGWDIELDQTGTLYLGFNAEDEEELRQRYAWQRRAGLNVELLTGDDARQLEPALSPHVRLALRFPLDWQVENRRLVSALAAAIEHYGVRIWLGADVLGVRVEGGRIVGVETSEGFAATRAVVLAAGAWTSRIPLFASERDEIPSSEVQQSARPRRRTMFSESPNSPPHPQIVPVRGQLLALTHLSVGSLIRHVVYTPRGYLVPRQDGRLLAGSTTEHTGFDKAVTAGGLHSILGAALEIAPAIENFTVSEAWAGLRPCAEDGWPVMGASETVDGLFYATGHYRNGILLAPLTGELIAAMITGDAPRRDSLRRQFGAFSPARFRRAAMTTVASSIGE